MENKGKFYITTAIAYASRKPHFGNTYEAIMTDAIARFKRQTGYEVFFLTGTDEHGQKIEDYARAEGVEPQAYVDKVSGEIRAIWDLMNVSYDKFIRTTDAPHVRSVQHIFKKLYDQGDIYKGCYEGLYCTPCESFFTETQAPNGVCPDCGRPVQKAKEEAYFFRMGKYADRLIEYINSHPGLIEPESRKKEMVNNFLNAGLQDLCVSRSSFKWGVPITFDERHVIYVWIDALSNYITALGYDPENAVQPALYQKFWPADVHIIGKDILRFHTIYWPILLMALGEPLPAKIFGHPWFNSGSDKMSKSKGNVIYADELAKRFSVDGVRYYALSGMPYASDGSITYEAVIKSYNLDLANNLGNLVNRTVAMTKKYFDGTVPAPSGEAGTDAELKAAVANAAADSYSLMETYHISDALDAIFTMLRRANKYIDETTPWSLAKNEADRARLGTVLYNLLEVIRCGAVLLTPFLPATAASIFAQLNTDKTGYDTLSAFGALESGKQVGEAAVLFARVDENALLKEVEEEQQAALAAEKAKEKPADVLPLISFDTFMQSELRCAQVIAAERIPKAKKLLKLQVDLGYEKRQIVSGIAKFYEPEQLIGRKVVIVANLTPVTLCGEESCGMLLAAGEEDVKVLFADDAVPVGSRVH